MKFEVKKMFFIGLGVCFSLVTGAMEPSADKLTTEDDTHKPVRRVETGNQELSADAIDAQYQVKIHLDELRLEEELEIEEEMYPADDLYGLWNSTSVNPYSSVVVPDTFSIDVSTYVAPTEGYVTSPYGPRRRRFHRGIDLKVQVGDTIRAAFDGKVRIKEYQRRGYGYYLVLRHNNGLETVYGHLSNFLVDSEEIVEAGQPIALGGNTGRSTGPHLHFETRFLGIAINPASIIDFKNYVPHQDVYVYHKNKTSDNKYQNGSIAYHRIRQGDTLSKIARKHGITIGALCRLNNIKPTTTLRVGRTLRCS